jgi:hypothetical protein
MKNNENTCHPLKITPKCPIEICAKNGGQKQSYGIENKPMG